MKKYLMGILAVGLVVAGGASARAQSPISDSLTVYDPAGNIFAQVSVTEANESASGVLFINIPNLVDPNQFGHATVLLEPDGTRSDIFGIANLQGGLFLAFTSDTETAQAAFGGGPGAIILPEGNGGPFDATMYLNPALQREGYHATFVADSEVPEPSSLAGIGISLIGLAGAALRRRRNQRAA